MSVTNLPSIQLNMIRYGMTTYFALGIVGNICNCIMFTRHLRRPNPSSVYFLSLSIFAIIYLIWAMTPQFHTLNHADPQTTSLLYCKLRLYVNVVLGKCLRYVIVFASADRFFVTRTNIRIRSLHTVSNAIKLVFIMLLICLLIAMHLPILMDIRGGICGMFGLYKLIYAIYQIAIIGILPPILMVIFSTLTILSLNQRHGTRVRARQRDRYLMRMITAEVIVNIATSIPYSSNLVYGAATYYVVGKSAQRLEIESFITFFTQFLVYIISVAPFYVFILTSKPFRHEFIKLLIKYWNKCTSRRVRITPLNQNNTTVPIQRTVIHDRQNKDTLHIVQSHFHHDLKSNF